MLLKTPPKSAFRITKARRFLLINNQGTTRYFDMKREVFKNVVEDRSTEKKFTCLLKPSLMTFKGINEIKKGQIKP